MRSTATAAVIILVTAAGLLVSGVTLWDWAQDRADLRATDSTGLVPSPPSRETAPPALLSAQRAGSVPRSDADVGGIRSRTEARPVEVSLASAGIRMLVRAVGVTPDAQMELPADPRVLGWYRFGPSPGSSGGSVVLAGHLDSTRYGVGPLVRLRDVATGDSVEVVTSDGRVRTYVVERVDRFDRQRLPEELFTRNGPERLRLITCGGEYDPQRGYEQNLVVTARRA